MSLQESAVSELGSGGIHVELSCFFWSLWVRSCHSHCPGPSAGLQVDMLLDERVTCAHLRVPDVLDVMYSGDEGQQGDTDHLSPDSCM